VTSSAMSGGPATQPGSSSTFPWPRPSRPVGSSAFGRFYTDAATSIDFTEDRLVILDDVRKVLLVEHGAVDLFAVLMANGRPIGRWSFLNRVEQGGLLIGSPRGPRHTIVGRPVPGSRLSLLPIERLGGLSARRAVADSPTGEAVRELPPAEYAVAIQEFLDGVEAGIVALAHALREQLAPRVFVPLEVSGPTTVPAGSAVRSVDGVRWILVEEGSVRVGDGVAGRHTAGATICLTERDWLVADEQAVLRARSTRELLAEGSLWNRLITHATRFLYTVDRRVERRDTEERATLAARTAADSRTMTSAARAFTAVVRDTAAQIRFADVADDPPALAAMRLVAGRLGIRVTAPAASDGHGRRMDALQRIAITSGVPTRSIRLEQGWWRRDLGPMIGFRKVDGAVEEPVALLPDSRGYVMALPGENRVIGVSAWTAKHLTDRAVVLYAPLTEREKDTRSLLRFGQHGSGHDLSLLLALGAVVAALGLTIPIMTGMVLGTFVARAQGDLVVQGALLVIGAGFVSAALSAVQNLSALRWQGRSSAILQAAIWHRILALPATFFSRHSTGHLATTALGIAAAQQALSGVLTTAALGALTGLANLVLVFFYDIRLALVATLLAGIGVGVCLGAGRIQVRRQRLLADHEQKMASRVFQLLTGVPKLRVAAAEDRAFAVWAADFTYGRGLSASARRVQNFVTTFNAGFPLICSLVIFALVGGPLRSTVSVASFLAFFTAFTLLISSMLQFTGVAITALGVVPMFERLAPVLQTQPETAGDKVDAGDLSGRLSLSHVSFRYGADGPLVLDDVSFSVEPGEFVAVVGPTGCGKSTILRLLLGFETPTSGSVLYDGQDLGELDVSSVRRQCGVVLQNGALLAGDIRTNIIGSTSHTLDDAWEAARMAAIDGEIAAMPMGMYTVLSEGTNTLSGGQRQRIMIARALVSKPRLVFFDEATSALDNPTQKLVAESTHKLNATRFVIAHRLSTIADADRIIVIEHGRIVQQGTYDELSAQADGLFARLVSSQLT
jgi:NHLM bacteriocin system ABC transporter ATP-binding protein